MARRLAREEREREEAHLPPSPVIRFPKIFRTVPASQPSSRDSRANTHLCMPPGIGPLIEGQRYRAFARIEPEFLTEALAAARGVMDTALYTEFADLTQRASLHGDFEVWSCDVCRRQWWLVHKAGNWEWFRTQNIYAAPPNPSRRSSM